MRPLARKAARGYTGPPLIPRRKDMQRFHRVPSRAAAALVLALLTGCGDGSGPVEPPPVQPPAPQQVIPGTAIEDSIAAGETKKYFFTAPKDGRVAVYLYANGPMGQVLRLTAIHGPYGIRQSITATVSEFSRNWAPMGLEVEPGSRVELWVRGNAKTGPYRFVVHPIERRPELGSPALPWETWVQERLDTGYDVDEFHFDAEEGDEVVLFYEWEEHLERDIALFAPGDSASPLWSGTGTVFDSRDPVTLPATGRYLVRMNRRYLVAADDTSSYRLMAYRVDPGPERAPSELQPGQAVEDDLHLQGDRDEYTFVAEAEQFYTVFLKYPNESTSAQVVDPATGTHLSGSGAHQQEALRDGRAGRFEAPNSGPLRVTVAGRAMRTESGEPQPYQLEVFRVDPAPEEVPSRISIGQVVEGESTYPISDIDEFEFEGTAGQIVVVQAEALSGSFVDLLLPDGDTLARVFSFRTEPGLERHASPRITLPADATYRVRVWYDHEESRHPGPAGSGSYRFQVAALELGPEVVAEELRMGDVVETEPIYPVNDLDTFWLSGTKGDVLVVRAAQIAYRPHQDGLRVILRRADTGETLAWVFPGTSEETVSIILPVTGRYTIEVSSGGADSGTGTFFGLYRLSVEKGP